MENIVKMNTLEGELTFRLDFEAVIKMENKLGHQGVIDKFNAIMNTESKTFTRDVLTILANCCVEREMDGEELKKIITPDFPTMLILDELSSKLLFGFLGSSEVDDSKKKKAN